MNNLHAGCGGIIRDYNVFIIAAFTGFCSTNTAIKAEIEGPLYGFQLCISLGITNVWIVVNVMLLVNYINGNSITNLANFTC